MPKGRLHAEVIAAAELSTKLREHLYGLYESCYDGTDLDRFRTDLKEKQWVILLLDDNADTVVGFSTQRLMNVALDGRSIRALFSGDTIIHPNYWGSQELVRAWCRFAGKLKSQLGNLPFFWFLISKGYRTYLYLPCFFHTFYPRYDDPTPPFEEKLIQTLAGAKYPKEFNRRTALIEHDGTHDRLKAELDTTEKRLHNPHVAYFLQRNPRYWKGDELVCIAEISVQNMRSIARREMEAAARAPERLVVHP